MCIPLVQTMVATLAAIVTAGFVIASLCQISVSEFLVPLQNKT